MPAGWIHAVYSPADAITFGGNFLHGLSMAMQVRVVEMEERLRVPNREKFPHFWPLMWYVVAAYCQTVTPHHKLLQQEIKGLKKIHKRLTSLPAARRACPVSIDKDSILSSVKRIITEHMNDQQPKHMTMPTIIHYHHEEPPAKIRAVEMPKPIVHPLVLIRLPSDVDSVKHKIPRVIEPNKGMFGHFYLTTYTKLLKARKSFTMRYLRKCG